MGKRKKRREKIAPERRASPGSAPGTLIADPTAPKPVMQVILYDQGSLEEQVIADVDELPPLLKKGKKIWLNVDGLGDGGHNLLPTSYQQARCRQAANADRANLSSG